MNWLYWLTLMTQPTDAVNQQPVNTPANQASPMTPGLQELTPDLELLMFLAEWDDAANEQWIEPEVFAEDSEFNSQLDDEQDHENNPDQH